MPSIPQLPNIPKKQAIILIGGLVVIGGGIVLFMMNLRSSSGPPPVTLSIWGTLPKEDIGVVFGSYQKSHPNATIEYQQFDPASYEGVLVNGLAAGEGPDVFMVRNRWIPKHKAKLASSTAQFSLASLDGTFPQVVRQDFVDQGGSIFALPISLDTLALYYNRDSFDQAGITKPPADWVEFQNDVARLHQITSAGQIAKAAAAIGGSLKTISTAVDTLNLLMLQNGTMMTAEDLKAARFKSSDNRETGLAALNFYLQFANAGSPYYTWNDNQPNAEESFIQGKTAMMFAYQNEIETIKQKAPFLRFSVAPMPQNVGTERVVNYADYWGFAVAKQSPRRAQAWDFVVNATTDEAGMQEFSAKTGLSPALRSLVAKISDDPLYSVFAKQALTARSWYEPDDNAVQEIFSNAIIEVLMGQASPKKALDEAESQITTLLRALK